MTRNEAARAAGRFPSSVAGFPRKAAAGVVAALLMVVAIGATMASAAESLKPGDRIIFLGDSITQSGDAPGGYVALVRDRLKKKYDGQVDVVGAGISGNKVPDLEQRLERDVLSKNPTIVVIYIGINDVWHSLDGRGTSEEDYRAGLGRLIDRIQQAGARVILSTPSVIGEKTDGTNPLDKKLDAYRQISREVADEKKVQLLDLHEAFEAHLKKSNPEQKESGVLTTDGVHLNDEGNRFVAQQMLAALNASGSDGRMLRHVVLFRFKEGTSQEDIKKIEKAFAALPDQIEEIADFEWGTDISVENLADGFTHCFLVSFQSEEDRAVYLPHPAHKRFVDIVRPHLDKAFVVDYWTR